MEDEIFDAPLQAIFGCSYQDRTQTGVVDADYTECAAVEPEEDLVDAASVDSAKVTLGHAALYAGLCALVWWWMLKGLMAQVIAIPCMVICAILLGYRVGFHRHG